MNFTYKDPIQGVARVVRIDLVCPLIGMVIAWVIGSGNRTLCSGRTSTDVFVSYIVKVQQIKPYIALHCIAL